ncbi:hypothetical protein BC941DRAFT_475842 [Chlamydoabsidia padenii]|nr:hypothetical protein BC941DRAFT_475842 [Chlamydoabsidia padenii]
MPSTEEQKQIFENFRAYHWLEDKVFQSGVASILQSMSANNNKQPTTDCPLNQDYNQFQPDTDPQNALQLLRAKHFYYSKFKEPFDFAQYLDFEKEQQQQQEAIAKYERMEVYDFDADDNYIRGLPTIIQNWVQQQIQGKVFWDKTHLEAEFVKAKAFYYSACVEKVNVVDYLTWKHNKERKEEPTCPFANLWQNKGKADLGPQVISDNYLSVKKSKFDGPTTITFASPQSKNMVTVDRIKEWESALMAAAKDEKVTSILMTATVAEQGNPLSDRIETKDTKVISSGLAYDATYQQLKRKDQTLQQHALNYLGATYYNAIRRQHLASSSSTKPTFVFINGQIPLDAAYMSLWPGYLRVATEHVLFSCHLTLNHAPIPPLLLLQLCNRRTHKTALPVGWDLYVSLTPECLRAPELLRLGLIDLFVPENQLNEAFSNAQRMALCPPPLTSTAVQLSLHPSYPGPDRISTWKNEITDAFGLRSFDDVLAKLRSMDNAWSQKILAHWQTLPPILLRAVFKAIQDSRTMTSAQDILDLEEKLGQQWRQSEDYQQFLQGGTKWQGELGNKDDAYPDKTQATDEKDEPFVYKVSEKDLVEVVSELVCPVTGQQSAVCPVTGQQSAVCPVTGQQSSTTGGCSFSNQSSQAVAKKDNNDACTVTDQQHPSSSGGCPFSKADPSNNAVCPVTGQSSSD